MRVLKFNRKLLLAVTTLSFVISGATAFAQSQKTDKATIVIAQPQKQPSDKLVQFLVKGALAIIPNEVENRTGKTIKIDKTDLSKFEIPIDDARHIITIANRSAHADLCKLPELRVQNYITMMRAEISRKKWTHLQILFIDHLHLFTSQFASGNVKIELTDKGKDGRDKSQETTTELGKNKSSKVSCSDEDKAKIRQRIEAFVKTAEKKF